MIARFTQNKKMILLMSPGVRLESHVFRRGSGHVRKLNMLGLSKSKKKLDFRIYRKRRVEIEAV